MGMIAAVEARKGTLCIVAWTGRVRLHVESKTYCEVTADASEGVVQVPEKAINCEHCKRELKTLYGVELG